MKKQRPKKPPLFTKIFIFTMLLLVLMSAAAVLLFAREFMSFTRSEQHRQLSVSYEPIISAIANRDRSPQEIVELAREFANNNRSFNFVIRGAEGKLLFSTPNAQDLSEDDFGGGQVIKIASMAKDQNDAFFLTGYGADSSQVDYTNLIQRSLLAMLIMFAIAVLGAVLFAKKITRPLEDEIARRRVIEENQRIFFSAASHELKTPIASARALVEGMMAGVGDYKDHQKYLRQCLKTFDTQANLVSKILDIVKLSEKEAAKPLKTNANEMETASLAELGNTVLDEYSLLIQQRSLRIQGKFPQVYVNADSNLLKLVLSNIIANAVQNTQENGIIKIEYSGQMNMRLSIANTGKNIPGGHLAKIFEPFYRPDSARTQHNSQTGLGLAIVKKALDAMMIPFALENTEEGVCFWMELQTNFR